eukprot:353005-Chlamydomonas_euryale.AAC.6
MCEALPAADARKQIQFNIARRLWGSGVARDGVGAAGGVRAQQFGAGTVSLIPAEAVSQPFEDSRGASSRGLQAARHLGRERQVSCSHRRRVAAGPGNCWHMCLRENVRRIPREGRACRQTFALCLHPKPRPTKSLQTAFTTHQSPGTGFKRISRRIRHNAGHGVVRQSSAS